MLGRDEDIEILFVYKYFLFHNPGAPTVQKNSQ